MTEVANTSVSSQVLALTEMKINVRELDALGKATVYVVALPNSPNFAEWSFIQQIAMLKTGAWSKSPVTMVGFAIAYANKLGLDIMQGDVYTTGEGRIATSNKAKIKLAMASGKIEGIDIKTIETDEQLDPDKYKGCAVLVDLLCTVTVNVRGWQKPLVRSQRMSEWYMPNNPNWKSRPQHMLELNTLAHAVEILNPTDNSDEAPPLASSSALPVASLGATEIVDAQFAEILTAK